MDSGACASAMPSGGCAHVPAKEAQQSRAGEMFGRQMDRRVHNQGERVVSMMAKEGNMRNMKFTVCHISMAFGSVSYIQDIETGEKMWMEEQNGLYVLATKAAPSGKTAHE